MSVQWLRPLSIALIVLSGCQHGSETLAPAGLSDRHSPPTFTHDFGRIDVSSGPESVEHVFQITNEGDGDVSVVDIRVSCGCLHAGVEKERLSAGESTLLRLAMRVLNAGEMVQSATVVLSDGEVKRFIMSAVGVVPQQLTLILSSPHLDQTTLLLPLRLYLVAETGDGEVMAPSVLSPVGVSLRCEPWTTIERHSETGIRPTRQVANGVLDFVAYAGDFPVIVEVAAAGGAVSRVTVYDADEEPDRWSQEQ